MTLRIELGPTALSVTEEEVEYLMSFALFCGRCGEVWGRVRRGSAWYCISRRCERHGEEFVGGSFFQDYAWHHDLDGLFRSSPHLLSHEFEVHMAWAERYLSRINGEMK
jgi:hypothetical protein